MRACRVQIALGVGVEADPVLRVDQLHQARQLGRILNLILRFEEDRTEHPWLLTQPMERGQVLRFQRLTCFRSEAGPVVVLGNVRIALVGLLRIFMRQLQEQQIGQLLKVVAIPHAVIAQGMTEVPDFLD